jgi:DNA-binding response OmpR family regulator
VSEAPLRVLIVEDEPLIGMMLEEALNDLGCEIVAVTHNVRTAMAYASEADLDVAVLDVNLNGQASYPVAAILSNRRVPFLFVTGYGPENIESTYRSAPVLEKPVTTSELKKTLDSMRLHH